MQIDTSDARAIVANPKPGQNPLLFQLAWLALKSARDQRVIQSRLPRCTCGHNPHGPKGAA